MGDGTRKQLPPVTTARSRDVLPHALRRAQMVVDHTCIGRLMDVLCILGMGEDDVARALEARAKDGVAKYGLPLRTHNGRDAREDARQELLDAVMYLAQAEMEDGHGWLP